MMSEAMTIRVTFLVTFILLTIPVIKRLIG